MRCPSCRASVFVLPASPLPSPDLPVAAAPSVRSGRARPWRTLGVALGGALLILALVYGTVAFLFAPGSANNQSVQHLSAAQAEERAATLLKSAADHIAQGNFDLALAELDAIAALPQQTNGQWSPPPFSAYQLTEIALYADLLDEALEELLAEAVDLPEKEWERRFKKRYQGKAILLDTVVKRSISGAFVVDYLVESAGQKAQLHIVNLPYFEDLPADKPVRVLLGVRLAKFERIAPGAWSIYISPDSPVLLTNPQALAICCPALADVDTRLVLARQKDLLQKR